MSCSNDTMYTDARVFVLRICVLCAFSMRCTHVRFKVSCKRESTRCVLCAFSMRCTHVPFKVSCKRESTRSNAWQDHEYSYEMGSVNAFTNQIVCLEKSILKCFDSVIGKSNLTVEICYIILRKTILFLTSIFYFAIKSV